MSCKRKIWGYVVTGLVGVLVWCCQRPQSSFLESRKNTDSTLAMQDALHFGSLGINTPPEELYTAFNRFCLSYFGVHRDTLYQTQAKKTIGKLEKPWIYSSERSAVISWESSLPSYSYIEYGPTLKYGKKTSFEERPFYVHLHYLKDLEPAQKYYYQLVFCDYGGKEIRIPGGSFLTRSVDERTIYISSKMGAPPYVLDRENTTYVLTEDIIASRTAFDIRAEGITLDLGGRTVTHANDLIDSLNYKDLEYSGVGIRRFGARNSTGIRIYNGIIRQGNAKNNTDYLAGESMLKPDPDRMKKVSKNLNRGFGSIELEGMESVEIAGVTSEYHLPQSYGMRFDSCSGEYNLHHNIFLDKGTQMFDRHGAGGARSLSFQPLSHLKNKKNKYAVHHNLIKRTRQNAINVANTVYSNEIYVDSWVVNSFAIQPAAQDGQVYDNKMFLTGYYACGVLWAEKNLMVRDNFIHMEGVKTMITKPLKGNRLIETWGEQDILAGMRITNYNKGGTYRENLRYENNIIIGNARLGSEMRGTEFFSDYSNHGIVFKDNIIRLNVDDVLSKASCINTQGAYNDRSKHIPILYVNNTLISNNCNVRFGDDYGQGSNHHFFNNRLFKTGNSPSYHTFVFDGRNSVFGHILRDCEFRNGADEKDVFWYKTGSWSNYSIEKTVHIIATPGARISIIDKDKKFVVKDTLLSDGRLSLPLTQLIIRPSIWVEGQPEVPVNKSYASSSQLFSPYSVVTTSGGKRKSKTVLLDVQADLNLKL